MTKGGVPRAMAVRVMVIGLVSTIVMLPVLAGLEQLVLSALADDGRSPYPVSRLLATPGLATSVRLTVMSGLAATALSLILAASLAVGILSGSRARLWGRVLVPFLAIPHAALAVGLAFVLAPSGWIARLISPWATGWTIPPDLALVNDPWAAALTLGLVIKETPFLLLSLLVVLARFPLEQTLKSARALGYAPAAAWMWLILPQAYRLIRLPVFAVLSYALSVVDMALILGPTQPPTLAVMVLRLFSAPDIDAVGAASVAALLLLAVVLSILGLWLAAERAVARAGAVLVRRGRRQAGGRRPGPARAFAAAGIGLTTMLALLSVLALVLWSLAWRWTFPDLWPAQWSSRAWADQAATWSPRLGMSVALALASSALALALATAWLSATDGTALRRAEGWLYLPLIVPQAAILPGVYAGMLQFGMPPGFWPVLWLHVIYVFPYVLLMMSDPWRRFDPRHVRVAASLGAGPARRLWSLRLPMLAPTLASAGAVGVAVSVAQYLTTLFGGAGRIVTVTTEAVALSSGSDRRVGAVYGLLQAAVPAMGFLTAFGVALGVRGRHRPRIGGRSG